MSDSPPLTPHFTPKGEAALNDIEQARAKREHKSKADRRAERLEAARNRSPEERAGIALRRILKPDFGPKLGARFDLGKDAPQSVRLDNLARGAVKLLREAGLFMDGLVVNVVVTGEKPPRTLLTCLPIPPGHPPFLDPIECGQRPAPPAPTSVPSAGAEQET